MEKYDLKEGKDRLKKIMGKIISNAKKNEIKEEKTES